MASTINAAVGGIVNTADASGELALQASGTTVVTLTTSGNVGIGTTSTGFNAAGLPLVVGSGSGNTGMTIYSGTASGGSIHFGDTVTTGADGYRGFLNYTHSTNSMQFGTDATERMRITSGGNLLVGTTTDLSGVTGAISDVNGNVRAIPQSGAAKTTSYTLVKGDVGEFINVGSGGSIVVPDAVFATGDVVSVFNNTSGNITITCSITTAYIGGTDADKATITLATRGIATILFISGTVCVVNGNVS